MQEQDLDVLLFGYVGSYYVGNVLSLRGIVYNSYVERAIMCGSEL